MTKKLILLSGSLLAAGGDVIGADEQVEAYAPTGDPAMLVSNMVVNEAEKPDQEAAAREDNQAAKKAEKTSTVRRLSGSIVEVNQVESEDSSPSKINLVVSVALDRAYTMPLSIADDGLELNLGDPVAVTGNLDVDDGKVYFTPSQLFKEGASRNVLNQSKMKLNRAAAQAPDGEDEPDRIQGQVDWFQEVSIQGLDEEASVIRVHMADGTSDLIHLGHGPQVFKLGLDKGEVIDVEGENKVIDGKVILFATKFLVDGQPVL